MWKETEWFKNCSHTLQNVKKVLHLIQICHLVTWGEGVVNGHHVASLEPYMTLYTWHWSFIGRYEHPSWSKNLQDKCSGIAYGYKLCVYFPYLEIRKMVFKLSLVLGLCVFSPLSLVSEPNGRSFSLNSLCISVIIKYCTSCFLISYHCSVLSVQSFVFVCAGIPEKWQKPVRITSIRQESNQIPLQYMICSFCCKYLIHFNIMWEWNVQIWVMEHKIKLSLCMPWRLRGEWRCGLFHS